MAKNYLVLEELSVEELIEVVEDRLMCGDCNTCKARSCIYEGNELDSCAGNTINALELIKKRASESIELLKTSPPQTEETLTLTPDMFPYSQTINMMKKKGYRKCYMCGSDLGGK